MSSPPYPTTCVPLNKMPYTDENMHVQYDTHAPPYPAYPPLEEHHQQQQQQPTQVVIVQNARKHFKFLRRLQIRSVIGINRVELLKFELKKSIVRNTILYII